MDYKLMMLTLYICITGNLKLKIFEGNIIVINFWKEADFLQLNLKTILHLKKFTEMTIKSFVIGFFTNQALLLFIIFSTNMWKVTLWSFMPCHMLALAISILWKMHSRRIKTEKRMQSSSLLVGGHTYLNAMRTNHLAARMI